MAGKPTYEELEERIKELEQKDFESQVVKEELLKSKAMFETIVESLPFDIFALDADNRYILQNSTCKKNWGDVIGKCPEDLPVDKKTKSLWLNNNRRALLGETVTDEVAYVRLYEERNYYYNIIAPIRNQERISGILGVLLDISELKKAEEALKDSEERYRNIFRNNHAVMLLVNPESADIVDANPAAVSFYGWSHEELTRKKITNINILTEKQVFQEMEKAKSEQRRHFIFRHRLSNGDIRDVEVYSGPIKLHGEKLLYSIIHDITERKKAEMVIEKFLEQPMNIHIIAGFDGLIHRVNTGWQTILGYSKNEVEGTIFFDLVHPEDQAPTIKEIEKLGKGEATFYFENRYRHKDGNYRLLAWSAVASSKEQLVYGVASDITERKQAEEALLESEGKLNAMLQSIGDNMSMLDKDLNIIWANNIAKNIFGNNIVGKKCYEAYHQRQEPCEPYPCLTLKAFQDGKIHEHDIQVIDKDGNPIFFHCTANVALRDKNGTPTAVIEISRDVTDRMLAEKALRKAHDELEKEVHERTIQLLEINMQLQEEIEERKKAEDALRKNEARLSKINECLLNFLPDSLANINQLTSLCGQLFGAACSLYNRLEQGILYSWGQWNTPLNYNPADKPEGHICYDVIKSGSDEVFFISDLQETNYAQTDPSVIPYNLKTYIGKGVKFGDSNVGSLCVLFQDDYIPSEADKEVIGIIASAIGVEEERRQAEEALRDSEERYRALAEAAFEAVFISEKGICTDTNQAATKMFGYEYDELIGIFGTDVIAPESKELVRHNMLSEYEEPYEAVAQRKDGTRFHVEIRGKMAQHKGKSVRATVVLDIDERKQAEQALLKTHNDLEMKVEMRTAELMKANKLLKNEVEERRRTESALKERRKELENKTHELEEVNAALKVLLKQRDEDKKEIEEKIIANVKKLISPYIEKLDRSRLKDQQVLYLDIIKSNLENIIAPFLNQLSSKYSDLTPMEIQVANLVKDGRTTKEIAELLNCSKGTIDFHRNNIRKKLGLRNTKKNLRSVLLSLA